MTTNLRLQSLDVFRGITIAGMIMVNNPGSWEWVYPPLLHARWHGCTPTDLVFPFFLFIVGVSICLSMARLRTKPDLNQKQVIWKIFRRSLVLFLIGLFINGFPYFQLSELRIPGVLQRIAVIFFVCAVLYLKSNWQTQLLVGLAVLISYWLLLEFVQLPEAGITGFEPETNLAAWLDRKLLAGHLWQVTKNWDPEGILSTIPAAVSCIIGLLTGQWLQSGADSKEKVVCLFLLANVLLVVGLFWDIVFPINKALWTSSYVLYTGGIALHFLAMLYWLLDVREVQFNKLWAPFKAFGMNAIFIYVLSMLLAVVLVEVWIDVHGMQFSVQEFMFRRILLLTDNPYQASFVYALVFTFLMFIPVWILYKKQIIIKV